MKSSLLLLIPPSIAIAVLYSCDCFFLLALFLLILITWALLFQNLGQKWKKVNKRDDFNVIIVGSGIGGICLGKKLRDLGVRFTILEKQQNLGGTWYENRYPGCACDIPSHLYSFSFFQNPWWSRAFSRQKEIFAYLEATVANFGLRSHIKFGVKVVGTKWEARSSLWTVETENGDKLHCNVLVSGVGFLHVPKMPNIPGMEDFQGVSFHTNSWPENFTCEGKKLAVIGTGATSVQAVPGLAEEKPQQLNVFQRTAGWCPPRMDFKYPTLVKLIFALLPFVNTLYRWFYFWRNELMFVVLFARESWVAEKMSDLAHYIIKGHIKRVVKDPALAEKLTPNYDLGCKRITPSDTYLQAFNKDFVSLITTPIEMLTAKGVRTVDGQEYDADAVIFATGFDLEASAKPYPQEGLEGELASNYGDAPSAYLGITHPSHPNFFILHGPGTGLGHNSVIFMIECQATYSAEAIATIMETGAKSVTLKKEVMRNYEDFVSSNMKGKVFADNTGCVGWYRNSRGVNWTLWPLGLVAYWRRTRTFDAKEYHLSF